MCSSTDATTNEANPVIPNISILLYLQRYYPKIIAYPGMTFHENACSLASGGAIPGADRLFAIVFAMKC